MCYLHIQQLVTRVFNLLHLVIVYPIIRRLVRERREPQEGDIKLEADLGR